jgi:hypothetical protein
VNVVLTETTVVFVGPLEQGSIAYVDGDWLPRDAALVDIDALIVTRPSDGDGVAQALGVLAAPVRETIAALGGRGEIVGDGAVAQVLRAELGVDTSESAPELIVDLTGDPECILSALRRLGDLGTLVLAGQAAGRQLDIDLYPDVHVRGLRLVGAPRTGDARAPAETRFSPPVAAQIGEPAPAGGQWYRISP